VDAYTPVEGDAIVLERMGTAGELGRRGMGTPGDAKVLERMGMGTAGALGRRGVGTPGDAKVMERMGVGTPGEIRLSVVVDNEVSVLLLVDVPPLLNPYT
jgi:signal peptidase I